jgi:recombinational DNA repair protein (RecF pathway)
MAPVVFHAIVLRSLETGNTSEVVHTLSAEHGRLSLYARGVNSPRSRLRAILQPLSTIEVTAALPDGADIATLRDAGLVAERPALVADLDRLALGLLLAEAAEASCAPAQPAPEVYVALANGLAAIDPASGIPAPAATARAFLELLAVTGYAPVIDDDLLAPWPAGRPRPDRFWLDPAQGTISLHRAPGAHPLPPPAVRFVHNQLRGESAPLEAGAAEALLLALAHHLEHQNATRLKSLAFWRRLAKA